MTVKAPPLTEKEFLRQVTDLATRRQWQWVHFLPAMHKDNWRTPFQGPLGKGWPDLVLIRGAVDGGPRRLVFAELKADAGRIRPEQDQVFDLLDDLRWSPQLAGIGVYIWRPSDWLQIEQVLR